MDITEDDNTKYAHYAEDKENQDANTRSEDHNRRDTGRQFSCTDFEKIPAIVQSDKERRAETEGESFEEKRGDPHHHAYSASHETAGDLEPDPDRAGDRDPQMGARVSRGRPHEGDAQGHSEGLLPAQPGGERSREDAGAGEAQEGRATRSARRT